jgi:hypothetical protein
VDPIRFELNEGELDASDNQTHNKGIQTMHTQPHTLEGAHLPKASDELIEFISYLATIEAKQRDRAIRLLTDNVDDEVWDVALLYVRTCAETRGTHARG